MASFRSLGCGDAFATNNKFQSCHLLDTENELIMIDCGATALQSLKKYKVDFNDVDMILISHFHGDHYAGLPFLLLQAHYVDRREKPLTIIGPEGLEEKCRGLMKLMYPGNPEKIFDLLDIEFVEMKGVKIYQEADLRIQYVPVEHSKESNPHGIRIHFQDVIFAYSGDTEWCKNLEVIAKGADLFVCECNFYDLKVDGHLNLMELEKNVGKIKSEQILLTHFGERMDVLHPRLEPLNQGNIYKL